MTDKEFVEMLRRNITLEAEYRQNYGTPYVKIKLIAIPDSHTEPTVLGEVRIDCSDLEKAYPQK